MRTREGVRASAQRSCTGSADSDRAQALAWRTVRTRREGRLLYPTPHGERSLIVGFRASSSGLTLHLPSFVEAVNYLDGQPVAVEVARPGGEPACVRGTAELVADDTVTAAEARQLEQWPPGIVSHFVKIRVPGVADDS